MVKVNINEGTVLGTSDGDIDTFLGIPYAQSFNSKTRFQHSQLYNIVDEMIDAKKAKPIPNPIIHLKISSQMAFRRLKLLNKMRIVFILIFGEQVIPKI